MIHNPQFGAQYILSHEKGVKGKIYEQEVDEGLLVPRIEEIDLPSLEKHYELF
jgi:hypothetical protein